MKFKIYHLLFFVLLFFVFPCKHSFPQEYTMPSFIDAMTSYDFDSDGFNDIIVSCPYSDTIVIMFNDGVGNFSLYYYTRSSGSSILCGLVDNDTLPDLITLSAEGISFLKNMGQRNLGENQTIYNTSGTLYVTVIKDLNKDNFNDLIYTNTYPECWGILKNNGDLNFTSKFFHSGSSTTMPYAGFLDIDSLPDIVLSYSAFNKSCVFLNNGNFNFTEVVLEDHFNHDTPIMNLDSAGTDDIGLVSYDVSDISLFKYIGDEQFELQSDFYADGTYDIASFSTDDLNRNGFDDFAITRCSWTNCTDSLYIYLNDYHWSFNLHQRLYLGELSFFQLEFSDLNGDSFPDIYMKGCNGGDLLILLWNDGFGFFSYENPVGVNAPQAGSRNNISAAPNPFLNNVTITINAENAEDLFISIYDMTGRKVKGLQPEGWSPFFTWDGHNDSGLDCPAGMYLIFMEGNKYCYFTKVVKC